MLLVLLLVEAASATTTLLFCQPSLSGAVCSAEGSSCANATLATRVRLLECQNYPIAANDPTLQRIVFYPSWFVFRDPVTAAPHYGMSLSLSVGCAPDGAMVTALC